MPLRKFLRASLITSLFLGACSTQKAPKTPMPADVGGCSHNRELPPLKLEDSDRKLLAQRSDPPKTAADYYFQLPSSYFSIMEHTPERRATYVNKESMTGSYIHASRSFECDGGGFDVTIRVFESDSGPLVGISSSTYETIFLYEQNKPGAGELESITVQMPRFWRCSGGKWSRADDRILPLIGKDAVVDRYRNHYKAHLQTTDQTKAIWLNYDLPPSGNIIRLTGRENFMDETYTWAQFRFDGTRFKPIPNRDDKSRKSL